MKSVIETTKIRNDGVMMTADDVANTLAIKKSRAYAFIRTWNAELEARGKLVIRGRINRAYFEQKISI